MKLSMMFTLLVLSTLHYEAQGIRLGKIILSASSHQEMIKYSLLKGSNQNHGLLAKDTELLPGINRKLMTKATSSSTTTPISKKYEKMSVGVSSSENSKHERRAMAPQHFSDVIDIAEMDYTPAKRKPPIHN